MIHDAFLEQRQSAPELVASDYTHEIDNVLNEQLKNKGILLDPEKSLTDTHHSVSVSLNQPSSYNATALENTHSRPRHSRNPDHSTSMLSSSSANQSHSMEHAQEDTTPFKAPQDVTLPESLLNKFNIVERILTQNRYLDQQVLYRDYPKVAFSKVVEEEKPEETGIKKKYDLIKQIQKKSEQEAKEEAEDKEDLSGPHLVDLFKYSCSAVENRHVTSADWNTLNPDLLAVSYGELNPFEKKEGLLLFWTLKSPKFPERIIRVPGGVATCSFSRKNPNLVAVGCFDGNIAIYDVRKKDDTPAISSANHPDKHIDTVWEVKWCDQENEKGENLISISSDGRIVEWNIKKGLDSNDLLGLKKRTDSNQKDEKESAVFRNAVGFSLDFPRGQNLIYVASTEEGAIHKCSLSYNDVQESYSGHVGPVYKVRCNPFLSNIMVSCSADWTVQVWNWRRDEVPLFACHSLDLTDAVNDIEWSPHSSTIFSSVCDDGRVEIWDLAVSNINPIYTKRDRERREAARTMVRFCKEFPVLVSGSVEGVVDVYRIKNLGGEATTVDEQKRRLEKAVYPTGKAGKDVMGEDDDEEEQQEA